MIRTATVTLSGFGALTGLRHLAQDHFMPEEYIAEVIESSTTEFTAQTRELHKAPPFGSFIKVGPLHEFPTSIAMVYDISTSSVELNRRPVAYGKTEDELRKEQPQIFELLRTEIKAKVVGYQTAEAMTHLTPPLPPRLHSFVYPCQTEEIQAFTQRFDYFRTLIGLGGTLSDELLINAIQQTCACRTQAGRHALIQAGKELSRLLRDDYDRLESILRRVTV